VNIRFRCQPDFALTVLPMLSSSSVYLQNDFKYPTAKLAALNQVAFDLRATGRTRLKKSKSDLTVDGMTAKGLFEGEV
jgi:hypothetical protein